MMNLASVLLIILDGFGASANREGNAVALAKTPTFDELFRLYPHTELEACGRAVGLPAGQMGNSEVGHLNIGAGRIVLQDLARIDLAIEEGAFFHNPVLKSQLESCAARQAALHVMGLCSDGGVHSSLEHILAICRMARQLKIARLYLHFFADGRDTAPGSFPKYLGQIEKTFSDLGLGQIATLSGRFFAMDRDSRWERTELAYKAIAFRKGLPATNTEAAIALVHERQETDEFITPIVIGNYPGIEKGDLIIFANFRADRARQLTRALNEESFSKFDRGPRPPHSSFVTMTLYDETFPFPVAFPPEKLTGILSQVLGENKKRHLHIAESEKYAHVTYFFNGGEERQFPYEERYIVSSPRHIATYDQAPEMSARELTQKCISYIKKEPFDFIVINYANPDMVGHTGSLPATIQAIETIDSCIGELLETWASKDRVVFLTADHGNSEQMNDPNSGKPHTAHTTNPVPFIAVGDRFRGCRLRTGGILADIAPTILEVMGLRAPKEMTGKSLLIKSDHSLL